MKLTLGFSPCPNDTFIFDALVNKKIDTLGYDFDIVLEDVQTLNQWALEEKLDISKISYGVLPLITQHYQLLGSGGALGKGVGPLLIAKKEIDLDKIKDAAIAIPGENTTAHMLFSLAFPDAVNKKFMVFSEIEKAILEDKVDAGVIIHENRFTYQRKGLIKLMELGEYWEKETGCPIPLGGIVIKNHFDPKTRHDINNLIKKSVEFAFSNYPDLVPFVKQHSQEMEEQVMRQHIDLYVNQYSVSLGNEGKKAISQLINTYQQIHPETNIPKVSFVE
jgi:1,4-dihydroxy-6-naphthoate synthase